MSADYLTRYVWRGAQIVAEAGGWAVFIPGLPVSADGFTRDEAITEMVDALREYGDDWRRRLRDAPDHRDNRTLVEWIDASSDEQLRNWLVGSSLNG
jgi:hypothetical protein